MEHETSKDENSQLEFEEVKTDNRDEKAPALTWINDAVIYYILPDRFASSWKEINYTIEKFDEYGNKTQGIYAGTIQGITDNIDYILKLGINCICLNPFLAMDAYDDNSDPKDNNINPTLGSGRDFEFMVGLCHNCNIKVIVEGLYHYCLGKKESSEYTDEKVEEGIENNKVEDIENNIVENKENKTVEGIKNNLVEGIENKIVEDIENDIVEDIENNIEENKENNIKFNIQKNNEKNKKFGIEKYDIQVCKNWLDYYKVDGLFIDINEHKGEQSDTFYRLVKKMIPDFLIIAYGDERENNVHSIDYIDALLNRGFYNDCKKFFALNSIDSYKFNKNVTHSETQDSTNTSYIQINYLDNIRTPRFLTECKNELSRYMLSVLYLMTTVGIPFILYGDEQLLAGVGEVERLSTMQWDEENELFAFFKATIFVRKQLKALRSGKYRTVLAEQGSMLMIYERYTEEENITIVMNAGGSEVAVDLNMENRMLIWQYGLENSRLSPYGFVILRQKLTESPVQ